MKRVLLAIAIMAAINQSAQAAPDIVTRDGYVFGGLVGAIAGFGIGHGVQGRYAKIGWAFTVGEGIGILGALAVPWIILMSGNRSIAPEVISKVGWTIFGGFRLWQITDLWVFSRPERPVISELMRERPWQNASYGAERDSQVAIAMFPVLNW